MSNRLDRWAPLFVALMLSLSFVAGILAGEPEGPDRASGARATAIDGRHIEEFDLPLNVSLEGNATVEDGALTLSRRVWKDDFERFPIAPWTAAEGMPRISQGWLLTNASTDNNATAQRAIHTHDMELLFDLRPGLMSTSGPTICLKGPGIPAYYFRYSHSQTKIEVGYVENSIENSLGTADLTLMADDWINGRILITQSDITFAIGSALVFAPHSFSGNFTQLQLTSRPTESAAWDNVTLNHLAASGTAVTTAVNVPTDAYWDILVLTTTVPTGSTMEISLLNASNDQPLPGLDPIEEPSLTLSKPSDPWYINPLTTPGVKLHVNMSCTKGAEPKVFSWRITWLGDAPTFIKPIPDINMVEDQPLQNAVDLRKHFQDRFTPVEDLVYTISHISDNMHVRPVITGYNLSFELPTRNWYGNENYKIEASDGTLSVESLLAKVIVKPVDDIPVLSPIETLTVYEDEATPFNLTPYIADVDTPIQYLRLRTSSDHVTVSGLTITILYDKPVGNDTIEMELNDMINSVEFFLDIVVVEVDDPPVLAPINKVTINEDEERRIPLKPLVTDEDTAIDDITFDIPDRDFNIRLDGTTIVLLFAIGGGEFNYTVVVSDGTSNASQKIRVTVIPVNDPPQIVRVGDLVPVNNEVTLEMEEGNSTQLEIVVVDEDNTELSYSLNTEYQGASLSNNILNIVTQVDELGSKRIVVTVSDGGISSVVIVRLEVVNRNDPPSNVAITKPDDGITVTEGDEVTFNAYAYDPDEIYGDVLSYQWSSDLDGVLSSEKSFKTSILAVGTHNITLEVTDGKVTVTTSITLTVKKKDGGGGNGNGGGEDGGGETDKGISTYIIAGVVAALVVVGVLFFMVRGREGPAPAEGAPGPRPGREAPAKGPAKAAVPAVAGPDEVAGEEPPPTAEEEEPAIPEPGAEEAPVPTPQPVAGDLAPQAEPSQEFKLDYEVAKEPAPEEVAMSYEAVALDTRLLAESDPEQVRLDGLKRKYQGAISTLPYGVPAKELQGMDWYELAAAMAKGEHQTLEDGREITKIGDHWYYSDVENLKTFLRRHD